MLVLKGKKINPSKLSQTNYYPQLLEIVLEFGTMFLFETIQKL